MPGIPASWTVEQDTQYLTLRASGLRYSEAVARVNGVQPRADEFMQVCENRYQTAMATAYDRYRRQTTNNTNKRRKLLLHPNVDSNIVNATYNDERQTIEQCYRDAKSAARERLRGDRFVFRELRRGERTVTEVEDHVRMLRKAFRDVHMRMPGGFIDG